MRFAFLALALGGAPVPACAQLFERPWLDWKTVETAHFSIHYPPSLASWARSVAERIEAVDSAVTRTVGYRPPERVQIVVEDPYEISNGFAFPLLRHPTIVFWASPPDPREDIGTFRIWGEMLSSHEYAHIAHLTRPSRNPLQRAFWRVMPVDFGPIALHSPRWVMEGYATYVEGRITGSGRPHGVWRPAILRQWAIEGRLPTYAQLSAWGDFEGGSFAYLAGSAYLEWLARREGDSSLVAVWRRLTARRGRSFDDAFAGVYGDSPALLYGRFAAELTATAKAAERRLVAAGLTEGELIQHLTWGTGDPAISPDGARVALVLRSANRPGRVVIWRTAADTDTAQTRTRAELLKRDPEDVPARQFYPPVRHVVASLDARGGRAFDGPRWLPDGRRLLVWRYARRYDGSFRPDLYLWNVQSGAVRRVTHGAGLRDADPMPDGSHAVATQCAEGHCDVVVVDLASGSVRTLLRGDERTTYYRPRISADGRTIAASRQRDGRWRVVLLRTSEGEAARPIDPEDGADRFDAAWAGPASLVVASDRDGTANLELLELDSARSRTVLVKRLTRVTGAAVAPEPNGSDHSVWFLSMHSQGFDVRRLPASAFVPNPDSAPLLDSRLIPAAPQPAIASPAPFAAAPAPTPRGYGLGPRTTRWLPGGGVEAGGADLRMAISNIDVVGRLSALLQGAIGHGDAWRGGSIDLAWRGTRPEIGASGFAIRSGVPLGGSYDPSVAADLRGLAARARFAHELDLSSVDGTVVGSLARVSARPSGSPGVQTSSWQRRDLLGGELGGNAREGGEIMNISESLRADATLGWSGSDPARFTRSVFRGAVTLGGRSVVPVLLAGSYGQLSSRAVPFERFSLGGPAPSLVDALLLTQRIAMPALPAGIATGDRAVSYRVASSLAGLTPFYWGASVRDGAGRFDRWHRVAGLELTIDQPPVFVIGTPGARLRVGVARSLDAPYARRTRAYATMELSP